MPFHEIGSRAKLAPRKRERIRVGFDTDQTRFRTIRHQGLEKSAGSAANIDHPVAGDKVQLFDNPLAPEMFAGEQTDRPVVKRRQKALAEQGREFAAIFRRGDITHDFAPIHPGFDPILTDPSRLRMAAHIPTKKEV